MFAASNGGKLRLLYLGSFIWLKYNGRFLLLETADKEVFYGQQKRFYSD
jgi:hypothetical protein